MTPEELYTALELLLKDDILPQLVDILSFFLGALTRLAFTVAASTRWN